MNNVSEWVGLIGGIVGIIGGILGCVSFILQNFIFPKTSRKEHVKDILLQKSEDAFSFCHDYWTSDGDKEQKHIMEAIVTKKIKEVSLYYTENKKILGKNFDIVNNSFVEFVRIATGDTFGSEFSVKDGRFSEELSDVYMRYRRSISLYLK